ncbi:tRNA (N(6)-L-threonylcarbamoyladenosine(37)-C(2))-methylthiotransferase [Candidatus Micrarchaeota archaeon]|nr:tRNA (N(6)-L-threonylcarbamoyladenosine(37)-C(2))-methylthiotransferase [Candidatus Micrarchaeota archaeon]
MKVYIETYGCTLNQADTDIMAGILLKKGYSLVQNEKEADVVVLNTCTVKGSTENKILNRLKKIKKKTVVAGCLSVNEERIRKINPDAVILWAGSTGRITDAVEYAIEGKSATIKDDGYKDALPRIFTKPILRMPVQEGCISSCFFCQTKAARPVLRSYMPKTIIRNIETGLREGAREIQITGMDSGAYGLDIKTDLAFLLENVLEIEGDFKIRVGMLSPQHIKRLETPLLKLFENKKLYRFLHIPVQSGSEKVVREMNRPHTAQDFKDTVTSFRNKFPDITIATDIIAGYPTETDDDFKDTLSLIQNINPDIVNISRYTPRDGTKAKELKQLDTKIIKQRTSELTKLYKTIAENKNKTLIGKEYEVLITEKQRDYTGRTDTYKQVAVKNYSGELGKTVKVKISGANHGTLIGTIIEDIL